MAVREADKEKSRQYYRQYYRANREKILALKPKYRLANLEEYRRKACDRAKKWAANNPEKKRLCNARYRLRNLEKRRLRQAKRRCQKTEGSGITLADIELLLKNQKGHCWWCSAKIKIITQIIESH